ncbi:MAG: type IV pilus twitching motility protein PilT [Planctomycetota bacterium]|jgi:twitching motility protein PilT
MSADGRDAHDPLDTPLVPCLDGRRLSMRQLLSTFQEMGQMRVSDLHLKPGNPPIYRVDGDLQRMKAEALDAGTVEALAATILSEMDRQTLREQRSVDSSCFTADMQFRLNCFYENDGLAVAIRALESHPPAAEEIGFPNNVWRDIVARRQGLVLLTGITGSGKSTTIASLISHIAQTSACRIITLEDPIEYRLQTRAGVISQREVGRDVPSFERGLRDCLREDPDVIFVGEMRDRESAVWTLTAAETGHLVFSTLHTRDVRGSMTRLIDMFPEGRQDEIAAQLSLGLSYVIAQKLIPRSDGNGRVVAMEILNNTYAIANLIRVRKLEQLTTHLQTRIRDLPEERMCTMERSLALLVEQGQITPIEAERWAEDRVSLMDELSRVQQ